MPLAPAGASRRGRGEPIDREVKVGLTDGSKVIVREGLDIHDEFYVKLPTRIRRTD